MNKKQVLIKGFEIGINNKDTVHTQIKLAELMSELDSEQSEGLCFGCQFGVSGMCNYQPKDGGTYAMPNYQTYGMCSKVTTCDKYKEKK